MNFPRFAFFSFSVCLVLAGTLFSQEKADQPPIAIRTNLMVLDSKGQYSDVKPEDLKILEDGVEQKILKLSKIDSLNIGFAIDNSGSLRFQLGAISETASLMVKNLKENDTAFALRFISKDKIEIVQDWTTDKKLLKKSIDGMYIEGGQSAVLDAVRLSANKFGGKKGESKRSALILISDCEERDSFYKLNDVLKSIKDNSVEVYVIAFTQDLEERKNPVQSPKYLATSLAKTLSAASGGMAYFPQWSEKNQGELIEAAKSIILELRSQYVVEYVSTNSDPKAKRTLSIEAAPAPNGEKRQVFARSVIEIMKN